MRTLVTAGRETGHIDLGLADLAAGEELQLADGKETAVVVMSGRIDAAADGRSLGTAGGRSSVFDGPGDTVYAPPGTTLHLRALDGGAQVAVAAAQAPPHGAPPPRIITPTSAMR